MKRSEAIKIRNSIELGSKSLTDTEALDAPMLFARFDPEAHAYKLDDRLYYEGKLYKVLQAHTSQSDWLPTTAVSLYVEVTPPNTIAEWKQPTGGHDAYQLDDKVTFDEKTWISTVNANVWAPNVHGWNEI